MSGSLASSLLRYRALLIGCSLVTLGFFLLFKFSKQWNDAHLYVNMGDSVISLNKSSSIEAVNVSDLADGGKVRPQSISRPQYLPGVPKPPGSLYRKTIVAARTQGEDASWLELELLGWETAIYVADNTTAPLHTPKNKGHEGMAYLTYIIDHYDNLPDVIAFVHSHQFAWHVDEIFGGDAVVMLQRLNPARVMRQGYVNLRCIWAPGCPDWMRPGNVHEDEKKQEEKMLANTFSEVFPNEAVPEILAQPCCAQFAVSGERVRAVPKSRYIFYRDWLLRTSLSDYIAGRVWEYLWHVVFSGEYVNCPAEHYCYCDGYGVCFGGSEAYDAFRNLSGQKKELENNLTDWQSQAQAVELAYMNNDDLDETTAVKVPEPGKDVQLMHQIAAKENALQRMIDEAVVRGDDPKLRAMDLGRTWKEADGKEWLEGDESLDYKRPRA